MVTISARCYYGILLQHRKIYDMNTKGGKYYTEQCTQINKSEHIVINMIISCLVLIYKYNVPLVSVEQIIIILHKILLTITYITQTTSIH
jgi:hypothetical protein